MDTVMFYLSHASMLIMIVLLTSTIKLKTKNKLRRYFIAYLIELFVWTFSVVAQKYCVLWWGDETVWVQFFENLTYFGTSFIAVSVFIIGRAFYSPYDKKKISIYAICAIPFITQIVIWTNPLHNLFYVSYSYLDKSGITVGWYFYIHTVYSYACLLLGTYYTFLFALRNKGKMNSYLQAFLICTGTIIPLVVNVCYTLGIGSFFTIFSTPIAFTVTLITYFLLIFRYNLLQISPMAMKTVINKTSDLYIVVDSEMNIIDYNEPFYKIFASLTHLKKNANMIDMMNIKNETGIEVETLCGTINNCRENHNVIVKNYQLSAGDDTSHFSVEFTPLIFDNAYHGCILLFRDTTQAMRDLDEIKRNQNKLIKQERLASLGQLIGGIAHNLKTPIMAISGRTECLSVLIDEYEESVGNKSVTDDDHIEIAKEMRQEIEKIRSHMSYISDIITTVKDQTVKLSAGMRDSSFTIDDLIKRINILMQHELIRHSCELTYDISVDGDLEITGGDINSMVQIIDNIIINAIMAYNGVHGQIKFMISQTAQDVNFVISDEAGGIPDDIQEKLFQQMVTSKGKDGTGLGLYISYSTVVGMFGGKMWFKSVQGQGTEFFITIPLKVK